MASVERGRDIDVEVVYALPAEQALLLLRVAAGSTAGQAIARSGVLARYPEIDISVARIGIFGKLATCDTRLMNGDRVEIYRPLTVDPKDARRRRACLKKLK